MPSPGYLNSKINIMRGFDFDKALVALQNELHCFAYKLTADKDINNCRTKKIRGNLYVLSEPEYHFLLRDDSFIFVDNGHDAKEIREALKTLPKAHYVVFMLYRSQISGNSRKDRSVTEYDKKPYLL